MSRTISTRPVARATKQAATAALAESHPFQNPGLDGAGEPFDDAFLNRWIDAQLGSHERRGMIRVWARRDPAAADRAGGQSDGDGALFADRAWAAMSAAGGHVWRSEPGLVSAVWGAPRAIAQDCRRALEAAFSIARQDEGEARVLVETCTGLVSKAAPVDVVAQSTGVAAYLECSPGALPPGVVITEAVRSIAGIERGLLVLSAADPRAPNDGMVLFGLPAAAGDALDALMAPSAPAAGTSEATDDVSRAYMDALERIDRLGDLKALVIAAAVAGMTFSPCVVAHMLAIDTERLEGALAHAAAQGLFEEASAGAADRRAGRRSAYRFADAGLQRVAFGLVPDGDRRRLHAKAAAALGRDRRAFNLPPEQVAAYHRTAANARQSKRWLSKAAWDAIARGESEVAIEHLQSALAEVRKSGEAGNEHSQRLLLQLLGVQLGLARGNGSPEFFELYQRSLDAASNASRHQRYGAEFRALWALQSYHLVRGEVQAALTLGRILMSRFANAGFAEGADRSRTSNHYKLLAWRMQGLTVMLNGQLREAVRLYDCVLETYDPARDAALRFAFGSDQAALGLAHRAWTRILLGEGEAATADAAQARRHAEELGHGHTSAHVTGVLGIAALEWGKTAEAALRAQETRAIASEHGFPYWIAWADIITALAQPAQKPAARVREIEAAIDAYERQNARQLLGLAYRGLGQALLAGGNGEAALAAVERGLSLAGNGGVAVYRPGLRLAKTEILRALGRTTEEAACREAAYSDAQAFGAKALIRQITLDGCRHSRGHDQIEWQRRYHASI